MLWAGALLLVAPCLGLVVRPGSLRLAPVRSRAARGGCVMALRLPASWRADRSRSELKAGIASFYDRSSGLWENVWGEHMHHGYYEVGAPAPKTLDDHRRAQVDMIDRVLDWATEGTTLAPKTAVDVGCGVGGSSRHIARRYGCSVTGITLSPFQRERAEARTADAGLSEKANFLVADALNMPFLDGAYDLVWSLESGEHMPDKPQFVNELCRVSAPGGRIIIVTWCHRNLAEGETDLKRWENRLLNRINVAYYLPRWCSVDDYVKLLTKSGLEDIKWTDWTDEISAFWPAVIRSSLRPGSLVGLLRAGWSTIRGAVAMFLMVRGYKKGLIVFGLITARKPAAAPAVDQQPSVAA